MISENAHECAQHAENIFGFASYRAISPRGYKFLNHFVRVTGDGTWASFVNAGTKEQWMHTHSPNKPKKFKQTFAYQKANGNCFPGHEGSDDGGIYATRDHNKVRSVL
jgi:hypothetical protein